MQALYTIFNSKGHNISLIPQFYLFGSGSMLPVLPTILMSVFSSQLTFVIEPYVKQPKFNGSNLSHAINFSHSKSPLFTQENPGKTKQFCPTWTINPLFVFTPNKHQDLYNFSEHLSCTLVDSLVHFPPRRKWSSINEANAMHIIKAYPAQGYMKYVTLYENINLL